MATFESIFNTMREAAGATGQKASELAAKAKIKIEIDALERKLAATYEGIGRMVVENRVNGTDVTEMLDTAFKAVEALEEEIAKQQGRLNEMNGAIRCDNCDTVNECDATFCKKCGKSL